jgi:hypothetical protein
VTTNLAYLRSVLAHPVFQAGQATTRFVDEHLAAWQPTGGPPPAAAFVAAALAELAGAGGAPVSAGRVNGALAHSPWQQADGFRLGGG